MIPLNRLDHPEEIVNILTFLEKLGSGAYMSIDGNQKRVELSIFAPDKHLKRARASTIAKGR